MPTLPTRTNCDHAPLRNFKQRYAAVEEQSIIALNSGLTCWPSINRSGVAQHPGVRLQYVLNRSACNADFRLLLLEIFCYYCVASEFMENPKARGYGWVWVWLKQRMNHKPSPEGE